MDADYLEEMYDYFGINTKGSQSTEDPKKSPKDEIDPLI
jgi:hypothetical protein